MKVGGQVLLGGGGWAGGALPVLSYRGGPLPAQGLLPVPGIVQPASTTLLQNIIQPQLHQQQQHLHHQQQQNLHHQLQQRQQWCPPKQFNFSFAFHEPASLPAAHVPALVPLPPRVSLARCDLPVSNEANEVSELRSRLESPPKSSKADSELGKSRPGHLSLSLCQASTPPPVGRLRSKQN